MVARHFRVSEILHTFLLVLSLSACSPPAPVVIGFATSLSGKDYMLGVEGRNAAELFVQETNEAGGINGQLLKLEIRDFRSDIVTVAPVTQELIDFGANVIVGFHTSGTALAALSVKGIDKVPLVSPSATSSDLSGKVDGFYRTIMSSENDASILVSHMREKGLTRVVLIADANNTPYVETYSVPLKELIDVVADIRSENLKKLDYGRISRLRDKTGPGYDAILIVASSMETGIVAQELAIRGLSAPLYVSGWAGNEDLIVYGGKYVDGAIFVHQTDPQHPGSKAMASRYLLVYGVSPGYSAIQTWDSFLFISAAIRASAGNLKNLPAALQDLREFQGLSGTIRIDSFGDARRSLYIKRVDGGTIVIDGKKD